MLPAYRCFTRKRDSSVRFPTSRSISADIAVGETKICKCWTGFVDPKPKPKVKYVMKNGKIRHL